MSDRHNYFVNDLAKTKDTFRNPYLENLLKLKDFNTPEVWSSILVRDGSVQHLDCLTEHEKDVFKTFSEISQLSVIQQAAQRHEAHGGHAPRETVAGPTLLRPERV